MDGAEHRAGLGSGGGGGAPRDTEVGHLDLAIGGEQDVLRLDVAMDQAAGMGCAERGADLDGDAHRLGHRHGVVLPMASLSVWPSTSSITM